MGLIQIFCLELSLILTGAVLHATEIRQTGWTGKLLVIPMDGSHWTGLKAVSEDLGRRGHEVMVVMPEVSMRLGPGKHYTTKTFAVPYSQDLLDNMTRRHGEILKMSKVSFIKRINMFLENMKDILYIFTSTSESLLFDPELLAFLREQNFDALLTDPAFPLGAILAHNLSLPAVYMLRGMPCGLDTKATGCPDPVSYIPRFFTRYTDRMSFGQRVVNLLVSMLEPLMCKLLYGSLDDIASRLMHRDTTVLDILKGGALWLMRYDFMLEFPKPLMPNMVLIGGINCAVKNPLPKVSLSAAVGSGKFTKYRALAMKPMMDHFKINYLHLHVLPI
ncbi:UDP-glucuronosyltransferase 1-6-like [Chanos chanos]|uniref:glucuronosyltransferase n=1 Tax=Chanos chanos TaxID=29144 RepID=A0A6J2V600_CHACN|nr:UDP-glucuronosyltransferase 1-6-like [Chanos chanos]